MKKIMVFIVSLLLLVLPIGSGCTVSEGNKGELNVFMPDGAPALAMAQLMAEEQSIDGFKTKYQVVPGDLITAKVLSKEADIAILPTNAAAIMFNKNVEVKLVSANVFGLLYMVGKNTIDSLENLKGEVVYNIGQGNTPDLTFQYILSQNHIEYETSDTAIPGKVALQYVNDGSALIPLLKTGKAKFGILGEPAATQARSVAGCVTVLDIQAEWKKITASSESFPQACLVVKSKLLLENPQLANELLRKLSNSSTWIMTNPKLAGDSLLAHGSMLKTAFTAEIIAKCNIRVLSASVAKPEIIRYLQVIYSFNPKSIGGKMPDDTFYYVG